MSKMVLIIESAKALRSRWIEFETKAAVDAKKIIVLIGTKESTSDTPDMRPPVWEHLAGLMWTHEELDHILQGRPSEEVLSHVVNAFRFRQRDQTACLIALLYIVIVYQALRITQLQHDLQQVIRSTNR